MQSPLSAFALLVAVGALGVALFTLSQAPAGESVAEARIADLEAQIDLIRPRVIVALGRVAAQTLLGETTSLGRMRGHWYQVRGVETRVTYHPAALLRNVGFKRPTWDDMQIVRDRLRELK